MFFVAVEDRLYRIDGSYFPPVGIEEYDDATGITVHPNPVTDNCLIHSESPIKEIWVYDNLGREKTLYYLGNEVTEALIPVSSWGTGMYFLRIITQRGESTQTIIKK